jgi:UDP-glucuronate 4-epimerase
MAYFSFTDSIAKGRPIQVFNHGDMSRDFTYIDDVVAGVLAVLDRPPASGGGAAPCRLYNIGNTRPEPLLRLIELIEAALGQKAVRELLPMQPGDVKATFADIGPLRRECGWSPSTALEVGLPRFVQWYREFYRC